MKSPQNLPAVDWVKRVNHTWLVKSNLNQHADAWLDHLASLDDGRLQRSAENARAMCGIRDRLDDPKPWFYAGLFSLASPAEVKQFLATHRITKATVPSMVDDEEVNLWIDRVGPETQELLARIRRGIARLPQPPP